LTEEQLDWAAPRARGWRAFYPAAGRWRVKASRPKRSRHISKIEAVLSREDWAAFDALFGKPKRSKRK